MLAHFQLFMNPPLHPSPGGTLPKARSDAPRSGSSFAFRGLMLFLLSPCGLFAQAASDANTVRNLQVSKSGDGTEAVLSMDYHYNGSAGPIVQIIPSLGKNGDEEVAPWFLSPGTMVVPGQGRVTAKVKFRKAGRAAATPLTTDQVVVRMLSSNGRVLLASATFPQTIAWGTADSVLEKPMSDPPAAQVSQADHRVDKSSDEVQTESADRSRQQTGFFSKFKTALSKFGSKKRAAADASAALDPKAESKPGEVRVEVRAPVESAALKPESRSARRMNKSSAPAKSPNVPPALRSDDRGDAVSDSKPEKKPILVAARKAIRDSRTEPTAEQKSTAESDDAEELPSGVLTVVAPDRLAAWQEHFTLGEGDVLNISLFGEPETAKTEVSVPYGGHVSFLEAVDVLAAGLTVEELRTKLDQELAKYRRAPHTMISPVAFNSKKYYLLGKIAKPGVYKLDQPVTIIEAVTRAGGLATGLSGGNVVDLADPSRSFLVRQKKRYAVNLERLFQQGDLSQNIALEPDDYVYFAPGDPKEVYVLGAVNFAGPVPYLAGMTTVGAIAGAGGFNDRAWQRRILVIRGSLNQPEPFVVNAAATLSSKEPDFKLQAKDMVYVSERPWIRAEELLDAAATSFVQSAVVVWTGLKVTPIKE